MRAIAPPIVGVWTGAPPKLPGRAEFRLAFWAHDKPGVVQQWRENVPTDSLHLYVLEDGTWWVDHEDAHNPDRGRWAEHVWYDVLAR